MGRVSILIIFGILVNSCCIPILEKKFYNTEEGFERPKNNKFTLGKNPYDLKETDVIKTNCVYQATFNLEYTSANTNQKISRETNLFLRFFKNGRYIESAVLKENTPIYYYNNLKRGYVGYYKIVGSKILLEHFSVGAHDCGKYVITELEIIGNNIGSYKKIEVEGLTGNPNW